MLILVKCLRECLPYFEVPIIPLPRGQHLIAFAVVVVVGGGHFVIKGPLGMGQLSLLNLILFQTQIAFHRSPCYGYINKRVDLWKSLSLKEVAWGSIEEERREKQVFKTF